MNPDGLSATNRGHPGVTQHPSHSPLVKRKKQRHKKPRPEVSPVTMLSDELDAVRRDLRRTIRAYAARLELDLAESIVAVTRYKAGRRFVAGATPRHSRSDDHDAEAQTETRKGPAQRCAQA